MLGLNLIMFVLLCLQNLQAYIDMECMGRVHNRVNLMLKILEI